MSAPPDSLQSAFDNAFAGLSRGRETRDPRVIEAFRQSNNRPEWMVFSRIPVIPPDLRPLMPRPR